MADLIFFPPEYVQLIFGQLHKILAKIMQRKKRRTKNEMLGTSGPSPRMYFREE